MKRGLLTIVFALLALSTGLKAQQLDPASQINWPAITGNGLPGKYCPTAVTASTTLNSAAITVTSPLAIFPYQTVTGTGIQSGTVVSSMFGNTITLSKNATATGTPTLSFYSYGMPYTDTTGNISYTCSAAGWITGEGSGVTLTTNGTSGAATLISNVLNVPVYQGGVTSVSNVDSTLTISPTTGAVIAGCTTATSGQLGCVKPDGTIITDVAGAITVPKATGAAFGVIEPGTGLSVAAGVVTPAFGTAANQVVQGGIVTAGGPTGGATSVPVITYNAAGQVTAVTTVTPTVATVQGGVANEILYQTAANTTSFITAAASCVLGTNGSSVPSCLTTLPAVSGANLTGLPFMSLTTTGTSGAATLVGGTLNIPQYAGGGFTAGGDLSGTSSSQQVIGLLTHALPSLSAGFLEWNGSAWVFASGGGGDVITSPSATLTIGGTSSATTLDVANAVTFNNGGSGAASGTTYNGATARTISYNTLGAPGLAALTNTYTGTINDFSGTSQLKLPVGNGYTSAANGECGYDTTNANWHCWQNAVDNFLAVFPVASPPVSGHVAGFLKTSSSWSLEDLGALPTGTVTSIATTSPVVGGTITGTGTLSCPTCVVATVNLSAGLLRVAGSTQTATGSELSGDATTSGSNAVTVVQVEGAAIPVSTPVVGTNSSKQLIAAGAHQIVAPLQCVDTSVSATTYTCTVPTPYTGYTSGDMFILSGINQNNAGSSTLNVNGKGALTIKKYQNSGNLASGDLQTGASVLLTYDGTYLEIDTVGNPPGGGGTVTSIATTGPIGGGTITSSGTITCVTCTTSASSLTANEPIVGSGGQGEQTISLTGFQYDNGTSLPTAATAANLGALVNLAQFDAVYSGGTAAALGGAAIAGFQFDSTSAAPVAATATNLGTLANIAQYDVLLSGGTSSAITGLAPGALGTFLAGQGSSANPSFVTLSAINPQTVTYQVLASDFSSYKTITVASGTFNITLVASGAQPANGQYVNILNYGSGAVTVVRSGQNINGTTSSIVLGAGSASNPTSATIWSDGTNYFAIIDQGSTGTVTSIATTGPITGGVITGSGTIACATCVTSAASLTSTAIMTGAGSQASQTPSATATLSSGGNMSLPGTVTATSLIGSGSNGGYAGTEGTGASVVFGAGISGFYPDSTNHCLHGNFNNADVGCEATASNTVTLTNKSIAGSEVNSGLVASTVGGTGVNNSATLTLGTSNQNWATLGTGFVYTTTTTGALSNATATNLGTLAALTQYSIPYSAGVSSALTDTASPTVNGVYADGWNITGSAAAAPVSFQLTGSGVSCTGSPLVCTISGGSGGSGTVTAAAQYDVPYYTQTGTVAQVGGAAIAGFQYDSTSGAPAAATATNLGTLVNVAQYDTLVSGGTAAAVAGVAPGALGTFFAGQGASANPTFAALSAINPQTATYQVVASDFSSYKNITVASGTFTITLVASGSQPAAGQYAWVTNYGTGTITIARSGQNINGGTSALTLGPGSATAPTAAYIESDGSNYFAHVYASASASGVSSIAATSPLAASASTGAVTVSVNNNGITANQLSLQYSTWACEPGVGDGLNVIPAGTYLQTECLNTSGVTWTIVGVKCFTDNSGSSTLNATDGSNNALLTGAITCSSGFAAGTLGSTTTIANGGYVKFTFIADGTSKQSTFALYGTY